MSASESAHQPLGGPGLARDTSKPLYSQLAQELRDKIHSGEWPEGTKLPPERSLCSLYGVSRITVRHAIGQLEHEHLVSRLQGLGTFVAARTYEQPLAEIHSFERAMQQLGYRASTRIHRTDSVVGDLLLTSALRIGPSETVVVLQLLGLGDGVPIVFYDSYFSTEIGAGIHRAAVEQAASDRPFSTLDLYREHLGIQPVSAEQTFEATVADQELSLVLEIPVGAPILKVTSIIDDETGPIEYRRAFYRADKYKFVVQRDLATGLLA